MSPLEEYQKVLESLMPRLLASNFSIDFQLWSAIEALISPGMRTLELGSGVSTHLFDAFGCRHTALDHSEKYRAKNTDSVIMCKLAGRPRWYDWTPPKDLSVDPYGLILVDGPPNRIGRSGFKRVAGQVISPTTIVAVDDINRPRDKKLAQWLRKTFKLDIVQRSVNWWILQSSERGA